MGFESAIMSALKNKNYTSPTPIQAHAIPLIQTGRDLLGLAQTGTGKTAAFALPIIDRILKMNCEPVRRGTYALILAPTRELVAQIADSFAQYSQGTGLRIVRILGGASHKSQVANMLKGSHILIATPGRLIDHIDNNSLRLKDCKTWVLDEVDQMLDLGFISPIRHISKKLPQDRQNLFFSATYPKEIARFAEELLTNPNRVEVAPQSTTAERVEQEIIMIEASKKRALMSDLLANEELSKVMVFTKTRHGADKLARHLNHINVKNAVIHGDKRQNARMKSLDDFKSGKVRAIVATDVAARGIDIKGVSHVINYDMPTTPEAYVHRIGRTARAEASGKSISICTQEEHNLLRQIERLISQTIPKTDRRHDQSLLQDKLLPVPAPVAHGPDPERAQKRDRLEKSDRNPRFAKKPRAQRPNEEISIGLELENAIAGLTGEPNPKKPKRDDAPRQPVMRKGRHSSRFEKDDARSERRERPAFEGRREERRERPAFEGRRERPASGEKRPFNRERSEGKSFGEKRPFNRERPAFEGKRERPVSEDRRERPAFGEKREFSKSDDRSKPRSFGKPGEKRGYENREGARVGERRFDNRRPEGRGKDKPRGETQYHEAPRREGPKGDFKIARRSRG